MFDKAVFSLLRVLNLKEEKSDTAQCAAASACVTLYERPSVVHCWHFRQALVLIEALIPGVIRAKSTTLKPSKSQLGL